MCNLVQLGKLVELAVFQQIYDHFENHSLFHPNHHGSLPHHSTSTALIQISDYYLEAADKQQFSALCLLDQSACYDLLCHKILKDKLKLYNFKDSAITWVMSYLQGRSHCVKVESKMSKVIACGDFGAAQGSVLVSILNTINSNDLPACHQEGQAVVYVDDDTDCVRDKDPQVLRDKIEREAQRSAQWLKDNRMCVAADKSKLMMIGTQHLRSSKLHPNTQFSIQVDGQIIKESSSEKLLGLIVNNKMSWKNHLYGDNNNQGLIPKLSQRIEVLKT